MILLAHRKVVHIYYFCPHFQHIFWSLYHNDRRYNNCRGQDHIFHKTPYSHHLKIMDLRLVDWLDLKVVVVEVEEGIFYGYARNSIQMYQILDKYFYLLHVPTHSDRLQSYV